MAQFLAGTNTSDVNLVAALTAMGVPVDEVPTIGIARQVGQAEGSRVWRIGSVSNCGKFNTSDLVVWWRDNKFHENNRNHPFAYIKAALWNRKMLVDAIKKDRPLVQIRKGDQIAFLHPDCSSDTERKILTQFNK